MNEGEMFSPDVGVLVVYSRSFKNRGELARYILFRTSDGHYKNVGTIINGNAQPFSGLWNFRVHPAYREDDDGFTHTWRLCDDETLRTFFERYCDQCGGNIGGWVVKLLEDFPWIAVHEKNRLRKYLDRYLDILVATPLSSQAVS